MLLIQPIQKKEEQREFCALCGADYNPDAMAYKAYDGGNPVGMLQFRIVEDTAHIYDIRNTAGVTDVEALIIMGRAALDFIEKCGIRSVVFHKQPNRLPMLLGAVSGESGLFRLGLDGYFDKKCGCETPGGEDGI